MKSNGGQETHIRDRVRKGATLIGQIWGIGKRRFEERIGEGEFGFLTISVNSD